MDIVKKIKPEYFEAVVDGVKKYELRLNDFECNEGDILVLQEWDNAKSSFTGRKVRKRVTFVRKFKIDQLHWSKEDIEKYGLQIFSLADE